MDERRREILGTGRELTKKVRGGKWTQVTMMQQ
jgi:hypothetical protein